MLSTNQAIQLVEKEIPGVHIDPPILYNGIYLFKVIQPDPVEGDSDPFYSVDPYTKKFSDFSVITDGNLSQITQLFLAKQKGN